RHVTAPSSGGHGPFPRGSGGAGQLATRTQVAAVDRTPPVPLTRATRAFGTCRSPHSPRSCRTASIRMNNPYSPGWPNDRPPPLVLTGSPPPGPIPTSVTNRPPSPFSQNPRSSSCSRVVMVNESYTSTTSTSDTLRPAIVNARGPEWAAGETVRSGISAIIQCDWYSAYPAIVTGRLGSNPACCSVAMATPPAPSATRQQSSLSSASQTRPLANTAST